jgi:hypothetical protein
MLDMKLILFNKLAVKSYFQRQLKMTAIRFNLLLYNTQ